MIVFIVVGVSFINFIIFGSVDLLTALVQWRKYANIVWWIITDITL